MIESMLARSIDEGQKMSVREVATKYPIWEKLLIVRQDGTGYKIKPMQDFSRWENTSVLAYEIRDTREYNRPYKTLICYV